MSVKYLTLFSAFVFVVSSALPSDRTYTDDSLEKKISPEDLYKLSHLGPNDNAEEYSGQVEGDMLIDEEELTTFNGRLESTLRWTNNIVNYWINDTFFNRDHVAEIHRAAKYLEERTCLKFVFYDQPGQVQDYIYVHGDSVGCAALVGRRGGPQRVRLQPHAVGTGCFRFGTILHEFLHAIGFHHMQNVYDRDNSIRINWENVRPDRISSFDTRPNSQVSHFAVPYDVGSVMHYSQTTSSANGLPTMVALFNPHNRSMGQRLEATREDLLRINRMYGCPMFPHQN